MTFEFEENFPFIEEAIKSIILVKKYVGDFHCNLIFKTMQSLDTLGVCLYPVDKLENPFSVIKITNNSKLILNEETIISILVHEILHAKNPSCEHDGQWLEDADLISSQTNYSIEQKGSRIKKNPEEVKFVSKCKNCGSKMNFLFETNEVKSNGRARCPKCESLIEFDRIIYPWSFKMEKQFKE